MWLFAKELPHLFLNQWHASLTTDKHNLIDLIYLHSAILERLATGAEGLLHQVHN
ncbi:MAG: hypothetical protein DDT26_02450 [Dehalococcoidia bacterium]|nr:hypothetical protein [Chloroflexota bacterium]